MTAPSGSDEPDPAASVLLERDVRKVAGQPDRNCRTAGEARPCRVAIMWRPGMFSFTDPDGNGLVYLEDTGESESR